MHYYEVAPNQIVRAESAHFTYTSEEKLFIGQIVIIEVGKKQLLGIVLDKSKKPTYKTKAITSILPINPIPEPLVKTALWMSDYYATHLGLIIQTLLPRGLLKTRRKLVSSPPPPSVRDRTQNVFTKEQVAALSTLDKMPTGTAILHGVTGSGKTTVYVELARRTLERGESVVILVPEIALTSQIVSDFSHHFSNITVTHSRQTEAQRHQLWNEVSEDSVPRIVIGPRSALFMPLKKIGLIVVDEFHEPSLKQEQSPRYHATRTASILGRHHKAKVILGSATPPITDYYAASMTHRPIITMRVRARKDTKPPTIQLIDMTKKGNFRQHRFLSDKLLDTLNETFEKNRQALIFHNRRGSASTTLCENCGWSALCERCFIPYTLHADVHTLRCHACGNSKKVPTSCPVCHSADIIHKGIGTKLIESELRKMFPNKSIIRFDGDTDSEATLDKKYNELYTGDVDIIVGTQVIAKGLDLPLLRTVGIVQADAGLSLPDYGANERTFQLLAQVVGRVGRSHHTTNVIVQSYQPTHPAVTNGLSQDYEHFYKQELAHRRKGNFPPFVFLLQLTCIYKTEAAAIRNARQFADYLRITLKGKVQVLGPTPAFYERQHDSYRWQLLIKASSRTYLKEVLHHLPASHWQFELDPLSLL